MRRITPAMVDEYHALALVSGPKKLVKAWELAKDPPSPFTYMLEKKLNYHTLVERYKR